MSRHTEPTWHLLQISGPLDEELATALAEDVPVIAWRPERNVLSGLLPLQPSQHLERRSPNLVFRSFPMIPGYARPPLSMLARIGPSLSRLLKSCSTAPEQDVLVCTTPFLAAVAERWPGPVVYWLTDRIASYKSAAGIDVLSLDRRMCAVSDLVCPNSERLREYLQQAGCDSSRISVLPNATRERNLLPEPLLDPLPLPASVSHRTGPVAAVIGNMGDNLDWPLLLAAVRATPWLTWIFVGPVADDVLDATRRAARQEVMYCRNACFTGAKPYGELVDYARSCHVAVLPYRRCEPTYSGSSTRFYEHLAACRPMLVTRGFAELLQKEPLIRLVGDATEMVAALDHLRANQFHDGHEVSRWQQSRHNTWQVRAHTMQSALAARLATRTQHANRAFTTQQVQSI